MKYKVGDVVRAYTDLPTWRVSWRGTIVFIGPMEYSTSEIKTPYNMFGICYTGAGDRYVTPRLSKNECWIIWDNGSQSRKSMDDPDPSNLSIDLEYLREQKLKELLD